MGKKNKIHPLDPNSRDNQEMKNIIKVKCFYICFFGLLF